MVGPNRPQFVLFGSSIVQMAVKAGGWGSILADLYNRKADIIFRGYTGWNSRLALQFIDQIFPKDDANPPSLVIVYYGGNDSMLPHPTGMGPHVPLPEYVENMKKIALHIQSISQQTRIIFLTSPPVDKAMIRQYFGNFFDQQERTNESCRVYSEALVDLGRELNIEVINLWEALQDRSDWANSYLSDGIHLTSEGSKIVAKEILRVIRDAKWKPNLYWTSMEMDFPEFPPLYPVGRDGKTTVIYRWKLEWLDDKEREELISSTGALLCLPS
ncbi:GDSL esterase/lipase CPRD49-like [Andrographis paniculata]|uniref:GDSL esterase/lipase CPRD49-like n=1 Tax=Andrographis paniculata TaxID=175694 RepID=UPI0021E83253|nr:GDSL esterase/lipase CPRD49-like [Andrographis paniculata]